MTPTDVKKAKRKLLAISRKIDRLVEEIRDAGDLLPATVGTDESGRYYVTEALRALLTAEAKVRDAERHAGKSHDEVWGTAPKNETPYEAHERMNAEQLAGLR
jgi:hypothetical protein